MHTTAEIRSFSTATLFREGAVRRAFTGAIGLFDMLVSAIALEAALRQVPATRQNAVVRRWAQQAGLIE